jgi:integrase/recombinase XerD
MASKLTVNILLKTDKKNSKNECPIYIRLSQRGKHIHISTGHFTKETDWNKKKKLVKDSNLRSEYINNDVRSRESKIYDILAKLDPVQRTLSNLNKAIQDREIRFREALDKHMNELQSQGKIWDRTGIKSIGNNILEDYGEDLLLKDLTESLLSDFRTKLINRGNMSSTINKKFKRLKTLLRNHYQETELPIKNFKPLKEDESNKERLNMEEFKRFVSVNVETGTIKWHAKNAFIFAFYTGGQRFGDICRLKFSDINRVENIITFVQKKTQKHHSVNVISELTEIISLYREGRTDDDYIFPFLDELDTNDPESEQKRIGSMNTQINKALKDIAAEAKITKKISHHIARHTFAQAAINAKQDVRMVKELLNHSNIKTTMAYLDKIDNAKKRKGMQSIFNKWSK